MEHTRSATLRMTPKVGDKVVGSSLLLMLLFLTQKYWVERHLYTVAGHEQAAADPENSGGYLPDPRHSHERLRHLPLPGLVESLLNLKVALEKWVDFVPHELTVLSWNIANESAHQQLWK